MELSQGAFGIEVHNVLADGDVVVDLSTTTIGEPRETE